MNAGDEAFTLGMWPQKGVGKCAGRPLLRSFLSGRPFHQLNEYSALRFPSHSRRKEVGRKVELEKSQTRRIFILGRKRFTKHQVNFCLICFCSVVVLELLNGQCVKPYTCYHNWKGVYWNSYIAVI